MEAESVLDEQMSKLRVKQAELQAVTDKLTGLTDDLSNKQAQKTVRRQGTSHQSINCDVFKPYGATNLFNIDSTCDSVFLPDDIMLFAYNQIGFMPLIWM